MKYITTLLIWLVTMMAVQAQPKASFDKTKYDMGSIPWKNPATAIFKVKNTGNKPLVISNVSTSCGCTVASWTKTPIAPGQEGEVLTTYDAKALGKFNKSIGVYCNAAARPIYLSIKGEVSLKSKDYSATHPYQIGSLWIDKNEIEFTDANKGDIMVEEIAIVNASDNAYSPVLMHLPPYLQAEAVPAKLSKNSKGVIKIKLDSKRLPKFGVTKTSIYLARFNGDKVSEENEIPITAVLLPDFSKLSTYDKENPPIISLSTQELNFEGMTPKIKKTQTVIIKNMGKRTLQITDMQVFNSALGVHLKKRDINPGESVKMKITLYGAALNKIKQAPRVMIITNDPKQPKIVVKVKATLK